jgi:hypothetical protein
MYCLLLVTESTNNQTLTASSTNKSRAFRDLRTSLKKTFSTSSKDVAVLVIPVNEFAKNYKYIIDSYNRTDLTKFISLETSLMIVRFYLNQHMRAEALQFINDAIYITSLQIEEPAKIRRYLEIGKIYEQCKMNRLAAFYKWISANRVFILRDKSKHLTVSDLGFKCLVRRLTLQFADLFESMKIYEQKSPSVLMQFNRFDQFNLGFPSAKKYLVSQVTQLLQLSANKNEAVKYVRYLFHEMRGSSTLNEFNNWLKMFLAEKSPESEVEALNVIKENDAEYFQTRFFKIPALK